MHRCMRYELRTTVMEGRQAIVISRWRNCGQAATTVRTIDPLSYPCSSRNDTSNDLSEGSDANDAPTLSGVPSRNNIASGTRSVFSDARAGSAWACTSAPLNVLTFASASACKSASTPGADTLGAWLCICSASSVRWAFRKARKGEGEGEGCGCWREAMVGQSRWSKTTSPRSKVRR